jgi:predicted PurR-regulated permease PerM
VTLLFFLALDGAWFPAHLEKVTGSRPTVGAALTSFAQRTRTWIVVTTVFGVIVAVVDTVALWALGVPAAAVWGLLAFITNYIPNIGFVIGLVPPALLALLEGGPGLMATVIVVYCVVNFVIQTIIQPKIVGDAVGLSTSVTFLSLVFWAWVLGALGALLAVPLTLLAKALLVDVDKDAAWVQPLITGPSPVRRRSGRGVAGEQPTPGEPDVPEPDDASEAQVRRDLEARPESAP